MSLLPSSRAGSQVVAPGSSHAQVTTVAAGTLNARLGQFSHTGALHERGCGAERARMLGR